MYTNTITGHSLELLIDVFSVDAWCRFGSFPKIDRAYNIDSHCKLAQLYGTLHTIKIEIHLNWSTSFNCC